MERESRREKKKGERGKRCERSWRKMEERKGKRE